MSRMDPSGRNSARKKSSWTGQDEQLARNSYSGTSGEDRRPNSHDAISPGSVSDACTGPDLMMYDAGFCLSADDVRYQPSMCDSVDYVFVDEEDNTLLRSTTSPFGREALPRRSPVSLGSTDLMAWSWSAASKSRSADDPLMDVRLRTRASREAKVDRRASVLSRELDAELERLDALVASLDEMDSQLEVSEEEPLLDQDGQLPGWRYSLN